METSPSPFIPSGTGNISPTQTEWRGLRPNTPVAVLGERVVVKNIARRSWRPRGQRRNQAEGQRLRSAAVQVLLFAKVWRPDAGGLTVGLEEGAGRERPDAAAGRDAGAGERTRPPVRAGALAPPPTRPLGGAAITLASATPPSPRPSPGPLPRHSPPRPAPSWEPFIGRRRCRSSLSEGDDWTRGLRASSSLFGLVCCALAQRKRRPAEGALLLGLDCRGGGDQGPGAGGLARAAAVAAADGSGPARRAHGTPRQSGRHLRLFGRGAGARRA